MLNHRDTSIQIIELFYFENHINITLFKRELVVYAYLTKKQ